MLTNRNVLNGLETYSFGNFTSRTLQVKPPCSRFLVCFVARSDDGAIRKGIVDELANAISNLIRVTCESRRKPEVGLEHRETICMRERENET